MAKGGDKVKKKLRKKSKKKLNVCGIRIFLVMIFFIGVTVVLAGNCYNNIKLINEMKNEKKELEKQVVVLREEKEVLETDILKLKDEDYIAKYVREKYYFSKDGELILKIDK